MTGCGQTGNGAAAKDVSVQDQVSPALFVKSSQVLNETVLTAQANVDDETIEVSSIVGIAVGTYLGLFNLATNRYYVGTVIEVNGLVLTMDYPLDSVFAVGDKVGTGITNMNVDGSVTPQIFTVRGADPGIEVTVDITRIIMSCETDSVGDLSEFGDLPRLTRGLLVRRQDGLTQNIVGWKTNGEIVGSMFDYTPYDASNPQVGINGFASRLTFAGQNKIGVAIRLGPGEELQFHVRDNLTGLLNLEIMVEGHVVVQGVN